jgi:hypothetical protein
MKSPSNTGSPLNSKPLPGVGLQPVVVDEGVRQNRGQTARGEIEIGVALGIIELDVGGGTVLFQPLAADRGALRADGLALQALGGDVEGNPLLADELQLVGVIALGEVHRLQAFLGDRHRGHDGVELALVQRRDHAIPVLLDEAALGLDLGAQRLGDIVIEPAQVALAVDGVERRVIAFDADAKLFGGVRGGQADHRHRGQRRALDQFAELHPRLLFCPIVSVFSERDLP